MAHYTMPYNTHRNIATKDHHGRSVSGSLTLNIRFSAKTDRK